MAIDLTERQTEILRFIRRQIDKTGLPPTRAEIAKALKFRSPNAAEEHLRALERKGVIEMLPGTSRGLRIIEPDLGLPVVGRVAAGSPILAEQHIETHYQVDPAIFRPHADYLLKVRGESMRDAGIHNGDLLAVHSAKEAKNGDIVVARLEDEVTVKRFHRSRNQVRLLPENPDFEPIEVDLRTQPLVIEGIAVGLIRAGRLV